MLDQSITYKYVYWDIWDVLLVGSHQDFIYYILIFNVYFLHACTWLVCWRHSCPAIDNSLYILYFCSNCHSKKSSILLRIGSFRVLLFLFAVSQALREHTYPFLAVIALKDNRMTVVARVEGLMCKYILYIFHLFVYHNTMLVSYYCLWFIFWRRLSSWLEVSLPLSHASRFCNESEPSVINNFLYCNNWQFI